MNAYIESVLLILGFVTAVTILSIAVYWFVTVPLANFVKWLAGE